MNNVSNLTSSPSTIKPTPYRVQNYLVIWVDGNIDQASQDCQNTMAELRSIVKEVNVCTTSAQCIEILDDLDDEKAFVISSGALGQRLVPDIHRMPQLDTIYIFCSNKAWHEQWAKQWPKIQGIFTSITPICDSLKLVSRQCDHETIPISFLSKNIMAIEAASNETSFDQFEPSFMYSKLLKEILLTIDEDDAKSLEDLVAYLYNSISDYSKALEFYDKAHKIKEATLPPNHPSLAISYGNIGGMYCAMGDYAKALEFGEKALAIQQKSLPSTHSAIKRTINNINYINCEKNTFTFMDYYLSKLPGVGRFTGPRHFQILKNYAPSLTLFGAAALIYCLYITDWKVTNTRIPIYGRKFDEMKRVAMIDKHGQKAVDEGTASDD
ncbi:unnamed protein product [Rotaria sp. Silwood1]|nr:unnamed protein product [Rotaria sp. Silwood1]